MIDYDHVAEREAHSVEGARHALSIIFGGNQPSSVLDVGCGAGTWLRAALDLGSSEIVGVEGVEIAGEHLFVPPDVVRTANLEQSVDLGRRFDLVLCLEVAEHLSPSAGTQLIETLTRHGDLILFSAAIPGQDGSHHVNCRWPAYWQSVFNEGGFVCSDEVRWLIWNEEAIEPWYRQNLMMVTRDSDNAGTEPRIAPVIHPAMLNFGHYIERAIGQAEEGAFPVRWYFRALAKAAAAKARRAFR